MKKSRSRSFQISPGSGASTSSSAWFFDKNKTFKAVESMARHKWLPYSRPLQRLLEEAHRQLQASDLPEVEELEKVIEVEKVMEVLEVTC